MAELDRATRIKRELFLRVLFPTKPPPGVARQLVQIMRELKLGAGETIYKKGEEATKAYFVISGEVELVSEGEDAWRFGSGSVVGVLDLTLQRPRGRTAVALTDVELLVMPGEEWLEIFEDNLDYASHVRQVQGRALHEIVIELAPDGAFPARQLTPEEALEVGVLEGTQVERIVALRGCNHFNYAGVQALNDLARAGEIVRGERGELMLRPGAAGNNLYVVVSGLVVVERRVAPTIQATFGPGDLVLSGCALSGALGEYAVSARTDALLLAFGMADVDDVAEDHFDLVRSILRGVALDRERVMNAKIRRAKASMPPPAVAAEPRRAAS